MLTKSGLILPDRAILSRYFNYWIVFFSDLFFSVFATVISFFFVEVVLNLPFFNGHYARSIWLSACCSAFSFYCTQTYKGIIRRSSFMDAGRIGIASLLKAGLLSPLYLLFLLPSYQFSVLLFVGIADMLFTSFILITVRVIVIFSHEYIKKNEIQKGWSNYHHLQEIRIEDLLERKEIDINIEEIATVLKGKVVMVTGAAGSIGSELCRLLCTFGLKQLVMYDNAETPMHTIQLELTERFPGIQFNMVMGDIRNRKRFELICKSYLPQIIYHVAAYKHVPMMENNPCESVLTNVLGTRVVADTALKYGVSKFIMVSTDKAVNPSNVMGASKRIAELYVQSLGLAVQQGRLVGRTRFITTRFGNVLGSNGSVIPRFREQLAKGGPLTVTHPDIIRYFMTIPEACRLVLEASHMGAGNEIFVFDMGSPVRIVDLAKRMIQLAGLKPERDIRIKFTGLRPGEKLYEELLTDKENLIPTFNKQIFLAKVSEHNYFEVVPQIDTLCTLAESLEIMETVRKMKAIIPEFISQSSIYEDLDGERPFANYRYVKPSLEKLARR